MRHEWRLIPFVIALVSAVASAGTVELRTVVRVEQGADVTLSDVARLIGDDAVALGDLVVLSGDDPALSRGKGRIEIDHLRAMIDARDVNWGLLTLRGGRCEIRVRSGKEAVSFDRRGEGRASALAPALPTQPTGPTVKTFIEERLRATFGVTDPALMRVTFEGRDADLLAMGLEGRLVEAYTTGASLRVPVSVSVYEGERLIERRQIRVEVLIERAVCVLSVPMRRGELITGESVTQERRWLGTDVRPLSAEDATGAVVRSPLEAGVVLIGRHVEAPIVIRRGGLAIVHYLSGKVILKTRARAMSDGRLGERIKFEALGTKRRFMARVDASDRAIVRHEAEAPGLVPTETSESTNQTSGDGASLPGVAVTRAE